MPRGRKSQRKKSQRNKRNRAYHSYRSNGSRTKRKTNSPPNRRSYKRNINYRGNFDEMKYAISALEGNPNSLIEDSEDYNPRSPSPLVSPVSTPQSDPPKGRMVRSHSLINSKPAPVLNLGPPQFNAESTQLTPNPQSPESSSSGYNAGESSASSSIEKTPTRSLRPTDTSSEYRMQPFLPVSIPSTEIPPSQISSSGPSKRRNLDDEEEEDETQGRKKRKSGL